MHTDSEKQWEGEATFHASHALCLLNFHQVIQCTLSFLFTTSVNHLIRKGHSIYVTIYINNLYISDRVTGNKISVEYINLIFQKHKTTYLNYNVQYCFLLNEHK